MELHLIKTVVEIDNVKLNIRFPGQLSFLLKNNHLYEDITQQFPLTNGLCTVGQTVSFETEAKYSLATQTYSEVAVDLIVSINTVSGKIVAGTVSFNAAESKISSLPLKRCSDKTAAVAMSVAFAKINKIQDIQNEIVAEKEEKKEEKKQEKQEKKLEKRQERKEQRKEQKKQQRKQQRKQQTISQKKKTQPAPTISRAILVSSNVGPAKQEQSQPRLSSKTSHENLRSFVSSKGKQSSGIDSRLKDMEQSNDRRLKLVNRQKEQTEAQLEQTRQRYRATQRKERQLQTTIKELKDSNQKRRLKISDLQNKQLDNQKTVYENERKIKQLQQQIKQLKESYQQLQSKNVLLEKKVEAREQASNEREKKLLDKLQLVENGQNKAVHQYNLLLEKMETQEKASQNAIKNKDRIFVEEKIKLKEQLDRLEQENRIFKQQNTEFLAKQNSQLQNQKVLTMKLSELENELQNKILANFSQQSELQKLTYTKNQLEKELQILKAVEGEKGSLKKKLTEQIQETQKNKDKLDKLTLEHTEIRQNLTQYELQIEEFRKQRKTHTLKIAELEKTNTNLERDVARLQTENNGLSSKNTNLNERTNDIKTKLEQKEREFAEMEANFNNKINSLLQSKQYVQSDVQDLKWALEKQRENLAESERKLREKNDKILNQEQQALKLQKQLEHAGIKSEQDQTEILSLREEIIELKRKERENLQVSKDTDRRHFELLKLKAELEQEYFLNLNKLQTANADQLETIRTHESDLAELREELETKRSALNDLQREYEKLEDQYRDIDRNYKLQTIGLEESDKLAATTQARASELKKQNDELKKKLEQSVEKLSSDEQQYVDRINALTLKLEETEKLLKAKLTDLQTYKKAVQQLLMIISKDEQSGNSEQIVAVPDVDLSKNQLEALLNRNKVINHFNQTIMELEVEINYLQKQNQSKNNNIQLKSEQLQKTIKAHSQKILQLQQTFQQQKNQLLQKIQATESEMDGVKTEKQKLQNKLKGLNEIYEEEKSSRMQLQSEYQTATTTIRQLQAKLLEVRSREISKKSEDESTIHNIKVSLNSEIDTYKEKLTNLLKEKETLEKTNTQKQKLINSQKGRLLEFEVEQDRLGIEAQSQKDEIQKLNADKNLLDQNLQQSQKTNQDLKEAILKLQNELKSEKELKAETESKLAQAREQISDLSIAKENLESRLDSIQNSFSSTSEDLRGKIFTLQEALQTEQKKSTKLFEKLSNTANDLEIKQFLVKQLEEKQQAAQNTINELQKENQDKRAQISKLGETVEYLKRSLLGVQKEKTEHSEQKGAISLELQAKKYKIHELQSQIKELTNKIQLLINQLTDQRHKIEELTNEKLALTNANAQLRENLSETKKDVQRSNARETEVKSRLATVQDQLKEKQEYYQINKTKNWDESQRQIGSLRDKIKKIEARFKQNLQEWQLEKHQLKAELETLYLDRDDLQAMIEERDQLIQNQETEILQGQKRIITLNTELRGCLQAWQKEKNASIPARKQANKIQQDLGRFQNYASELDKKTKEALTMNTLKARDDSMARTAQSLIELLELQHKAKSKALGVVGESEKAEIVKEYDKMREVIEKLLKSQQNVQISQG